MQTSKGEPKTKKSKAKVSKTSTSNPNPDVQESPQAASSSETAEQQTAPAVQLLDLNRIVNSTYNPRKDFRPETLQELADSIRQVGVLQPICVRPKEGGFEIVYGERRYWAAAMAGLKFIPALVRELTDAEAEDAAITENLQREDVTPREEAAAYKRALESGRHTIESLVGKFGKSEGYIRSRLKLCDLIDALAEQLDREEISVGVATEIAKYDAEGSAGGLRRAFLGRLPPVVEECPDQGDCPAALRSLHDAPGYLPFRQDRMPHLPSQYSQPNPFQG